MSWGQTWAHRPRTKSRTLNEGHRVTQQASICEEVGVSLNSGWMWGWGRERCRPVFHGRAFKMQRN